MRVSDYIASLSNYPIPEQSIRAMCERRGVESGDRYEPSREMSLLTADAYLWLSGAPNISQDGISYSISDNDKANYRRQAKAIYDMLGDADNPLAGTQYGYQGDRL